MKPVTALFGKSHRHRYQNGDSPKGDDHFPLPPPLPQSDDTADEATIAKLEEHGYTPNLIQAIQNSIRTDVALRYWIIDNSSSMTARDGHQVLFHPHDPLLNTNNNMQTEDSHHSIGSDSSDGGPLIEILNGCRRWDELVSCVEHVIEMSAILSAPTRFRLLNKSFPAIYESNFDICPQQQQQHGGSIPLKRQVDHAMAVIRAAEPEGSTPLTLHIQEIHRQVEQMKHELQAQKRRVSVTICTDGLPTSPHFGDDGEQHQKEFVKALAELQSLPVSIVFRLCTDDPKVVDFYHSVNHKLGYRATNFTIDVLNDYEHEAQEVYKKNPWITYSLALHRMREMGAHDGVLNSLDEKALASNHKQAAKLCQVILGQEAFTSSGTTNDDERGQKNRSDDDAWWKSFLDTVDKASQEAPKQWNPVYKRPKKVISAKKLAGALPAAGFLKHHPHQHKHHRALGHEQLGAIKEDS